MNTTKNNDIFKGIIAILLYFAVAVFGVDWNCFYGRDRIVFRTIDGSCHVLGLWNCGKDLNESFHMSFRRGKDWKNTWKFFGI